MAAVLSYAMVMLGITLHYNQISYILHACGHVGV